MLCNYNGEYVALQHFMLGYQLIPINTEKSEIMQLIPLEYGMNILCVLWYVFVVYSVYFRYNILLAEPFNSIHSYFCLQNKESKLFVYS